MTPEPDHSKLARTIVEGAAARGFGRRSRTHLIAVVVWAAFLGAVLILLAWLALPVEWAAGPSVPFDRLTVVFLIAWLLSLVPAATAALLTRSQTELRPPRDKP